MWSGKRAKDFDTFEDLLFGCSVADSEMGVLFAEDVAGDYEEVVFNGLFDESGGSLAWGFYKCVESAGGFCHFEFVFEAIINKVAFFSILGDVFAYVEVECSYCGFLERRWCADECVLLDFGHLFEYWF